LRHLVANEPATIRRDAEGLHQMRVALRRLRSAISLFYDILSDDRLDTIKTELRWLAREFGPARDLDTFFIEVLKPLRKQHANEPGFVSISKMFARRRLKSHRQALEAVRSARFRRLVLDTAEWVEAGPWSRSENSLMLGCREMPIEIYAANQLSQRLKRIRRRGAKLSNHSPEQLHRLRIQGKKARYAVEFFSSVYRGKKAAKQRKKNLSSLMQLQRCLGGINDVMTRKALCADILASPGRGLTGEQNRHRAFAIGLIIGDQEAHIQQLVDSARKACFRFDSAKIFWKLPRQPLAAVQPLPPSGGNQL
jgi:triphosphatase